MTAIEVRDWRGATITPGSRVIYATRTAGRIGTQGVMVEGIVCDQKTTNAGRVLIEVVRRSRDQWRNGEQVYVGVEHLTVVQHMPRTPLQEQPRKPAPRRDPGCYGTTTFAESRAFLSTLAEVRADRRAGR